MAGVSSICFGIFQEDFAFFEVAFLEMVSLWHGKITRQKYGAVLGTMQEDF